MFKSVPGYSQYKQHFSESPSAAKHFEEVVARAWESDPYRRGQFSARYEDGNETLATIHFECEDAKGQLPLSRQETSSIYRLEPQPFSEWSEYGFPLEGGGEDSTGGETKRWYKWEPDYDEGEL